MAASGGVSLLVFLTTAAAVIAPWFYFAIHKAPGRGLTSTRSLLNIFVLLHSLYLLYQLIVLPPTNIFARLRIPVSTPADAIRAVLLAQSDTGDLPPPLETLLKRLGSFDVKTYYIRRFGHAVVTTCDYCLAFDDFGLFAVPRALLSYICAAAAIGVITIASSGHERYRTLAVAAVAGAFCVEAYYIATATIQIPKDDAPVFMVRHALAK
ncbi:hypothetical protein B0H17DRAFT_927151 [Mycena rosella]|uniref:Uncharacterized protein n=1 Tax=Mycena rosella TaxID=1033263 RepID=A0AAD7DV35_MYCRO|nr:hypothetical protein B0H17DRAFT_927151 [Mycena rosella]